MRAVYGSLSYVPYTEFGRVRTFVRWNRLKWKGPPLRSSTVDANSSKSSGPSHPSKRRRATYRRISAEPASMPRIAERCIARTKLHLASARFIPLLEPQPIIENVRGLNCPGWSLNGFAAPEECTKTWFLRNSRLNYNGVEVTEGVSCPGKVCIKRNACFYSRTLTSTARRFNAQIMLFNTTPKRGLAISRVTAHEFMLHETVLTSHRVTD